MTDPRPAKKSALPLGTPPDPEIVKRHLAAIRDAEHTLTQSKYWLASYLSTHAATTCEAKHLDRTPKCDRATDGILTISCGHYVFLCAEHGSDAIRVHGVAHDTWCDGTDGPKLHEGSVYNVKLEWVGLA